MAATNNGLSVGLPLSIVSLGIVLVGGWYFQSSENTNAKNKGKEQTQTIQLQEMVEEQLNELQLLLGRDSIHHK